MRAGKPKQVIVVGARIFLKIIVKRKNRCVTISVSTHGPLMSLERHYILCADMQGRRVALENAVNRGVSSGAAEWAGCGQVVQGSDSKKMRLSIVS
jgi:hypothetical protein